jgi:sugar O-acyltransferase (sialic acid O-acetyltransferase NeuD family)
MKEKIAIFGIGGHAKVIYDIVVKENKYEVGGFFSLESTLKNFLGVAHFSQTEFLGSPFKKGIIAIGDNWTRGRLAKELQAIKSDFQFVSAIHPSSVVAATATVASGTVIMANVVVNPGCKIGEHVILNTSSSVDHDCEISSLASLGPGCVLGGNVDIGECSAISLGAKIIHGKSIGRNTVIGAGSLVLENIPDGVVAFGAPCKVQKQREASEKYL